MFKTLFKCALLGSAFFMALSAYSEPSCTTGAAIQFPKTIPTGELTLEQQKQVAYVTLYKSIREPRWDDQPTPKSKWVFDKDVDGVVYAKLQGSSWDLYAAISFEAGSMATIVCDSRNLKQKETSIHRNVPAYKDRLDAALADRVARAQQMGMD